MSCEGGGDVTSRAWETSRDQRAAMPTHSSSAHPKGHPLTGLGTLREGVGVPWSFTFKGKGIGVLSSLQLPGSEFKHHQNIPGPPGMPDLRGHEVRCGCDCRAGLCLSGARPVLSCL